MPRGVPGPVKRPKSDKAAEVANRYIGPKGGKPKKKAPPSNPPVEVYYTVKESADAEGKRDEFGRFVKGGPPGPGRPKGSLNKFSGDVKLAILDGLNSAHPEGLAFWVWALAEQNPTSAAALLGRLIPVTTDAKIDLKHEVTVKFE